MLLMLSTTVSGKNIGVVSKAVVGRDGDSIKVYLRLNPELMEVASAEMLTVTPCLVAEGDSVALPNIYVMGRQAYYRYLRHDDLGLVMPTDDVIWEKRRYRPYAYLKAAQWKEWMNGAVLKVHVTLGDCSRLQLSDDVMLPATKTTRQITPPRVSVLHESVSDRMTIVFPLNRTELVPGLFDNRQQLEKIEKSIEQIKNDEQTELEQITIKGYASPEGLYANNRRLAQGRTESVRSYISDHYDVDREKTVIDFEPEDWEGLTEFIRGATTEQLPHRDQLLEIIGRRWPADIKERQMRRRYPQDFRYLLDHCMPLLRHTDYLIDYSRKVTKTTAGDTLLVTAMPPLTDSLQSTGQPYNTYRKWLALKTNLLFDAALAFNGEIEVPIGRNNRWSVMGEIWKPWYVWHHNSRAYQLQVLGVEARYWWGRCRSWRPALTGWFVGAYYANGKYDLEWNSEGEQGNFDSIGLTMGYCWPIHRHWNLELSAGVGFLKGTRYHYEGKYNDTHLIWQYTKTTSYVGPTKLKLSLVWLLGTKRKEGGT